METNLNDMVKHIVNSDEENAALSFHGYVKEKMRTMVAARHSTAQDNNTAPDPNK